MKKLTAILIGTLIASSAVLAQTNEVLSRNAVGYVKVALEDNKLYLLSNPFINLESLDGNDSLTNALASTPNQSVVSVWNEGTQTYDDYVKDFLGNWSGTGVSTVQLSRSDAFFVQTGAGGAADLFLMGEVPDDATENVARVPGLTMIGNPYPVSILLTQTVMSVDLPPQTVVSVWDIGSQSYVDAAKDFLGNWSGAAGFTLLPGQGIIVDNSAAGNNWNETKPYTWP